MLAIGIVLEFCVDVGKSGSSWSCRTISTSIRRIAVSNSIFVFVCVYLFALCVPCALLQDKVKHLAWRDADIQFIKEHGFDEAVTAHLTDGGVDNSKVVVAGKELLETFHIGKDIFWPENAFLVFWKMSCEEAGYVVESHDLPDGTSIKGCRTSYTQDDEPLQPGCFLISRDFRLKVGMQERVKRERDDSGEQLAATMRTMAKRMQAPKAPDAIPVPALKRRRLALLEAEKEDAHAGEGDAAGQENARKVGIEVDDDEMAIFDQVDVINKSTASNMADEIPAAPPAKAAKPGQQAKPSADVADDVDEEEAGGADPPALPKSAKGARKK